MLIGPRISHMFWPFVPLLLWPDPSTWLSVYEEDKKEARSADD